MTLFDVELQFGQALPVPSGRVESVYLLLNANEVRYVGSAVLPMRRIAQHVEDGRIRFDDAKVYLPPSGRMFDLEYKLIRWCRPPDNRKGRGHGVAGDRFLATEIRRLLRDGA